MPAAFGRKAFPAGLVNESPFLKNTQAGEVVSLMSQDHGLLTLWCRHWISLIRSLSAEVEELELRGHEVICSMSKCRAFPSSVGVVSLNSLRAVEVPNWPHLAGISFYHLPLCTAHIVFFYVCPDGRKLSKLLCSLSLTLSAQQLFPPPRSAFWGEGAVIGASLC